MYEYKAELVRVVDGDTIIVNIDLGMDVWLHQVRIRLLHINAPEMKTPEGPIAKAYLESLIKGQSLSVTTKSKDKYGRRLAEVVTKEGVNLSEAMKPHSVVYLP
jgi:micrococcal nuclease